MVVRRSIQIYSWASGGFRIWAPAEQRSESYPMEMSCTKLYLVVEPESAGYVVRQDEFL
jgi:hypothetical protein